MDFGLGLYYIYCFLCIFSSSHDSLYDGGIKMKYTPEVLNHWFNDRERKNKDLDGWFRQLPDDDKLKVFKLWYMGDLDQKAIHLLTTPETITRCRRIIQNDLGLFLPSNEHTIETRNICKEAVKQWSKHEF